MLIEKLTAISIIGLLANAAVPTMLKAIGDAKLTAALLQLHQTSKQSRYDAIVHYGSIRSVTIYSNPPAISECRDTANATLRDRVCNKSVALPSGIVVKSTFRGIGSPIAGKKDAGVATVISWASETNAGIGGSYGQHGTVTFSHPWTHRRFCLVRGGAFGNTGEWIIRKDKECK
ncbi:MAG: type II secretion system GspH family protein [Oscillatoriaceae cyanobacterium Prado104]|nr:type II secretion system GspH family protein [Oscillatoriaceae cyanobacterium Prado104]